MIGNATRRHRTTPWLALALLLGAGPAAAGVVTNLSDSGAGSLRDQVNAGGAVTFGVGLTGTINLTSGPISITSATPSISGPGANAITINASGNAGRIFNIVSTGTTTTVSGLTLTGGSAGPTSQGGAVLNNGTLTLNAVAVTSNAASDGGGGIYNTGSLTVTSSLFTGNTVTASTCAGGGAIRSEGPGSSLVVRDSTITANSAPSCNGGGISFNNGTASIIASTITANNAGLGGGNVYKGSAAAGLTLGTSVISDGTTGGGTPANPDLHGAFGGGLTSSGYNLVKARGDGIGYVATDLADGTSSQLSSLTNHGGTTATQLPNIGSPLLDARPAPCPTANDQRGFARPQGTSCDIGAVEYRHAALTATIVGSGTVSAGASPVPLSGTITNCATSCAADYDGELAPTVTLTATPNANQGFTSWSGACSGTNPVTTVAMTAAKTCTATFVPLTYSVTSSVAGGNGSISPLGAQTVNAGATAVFTLTPSANYHVGSVDGTCGGVLSGPNNTTYTTNAVNANCTVVAHFAIDQHVVLASVAGGNGTITPTGAVNVDHGSNAVFSLSPSPNYHVASVDGSCGGVLSGPNNTTYTTAAVTADCTVVAHFTIDQHTVTPSVSGGNGTITPSTPQLVNHGATTVFTLAPSANYHVASVDGTCNGTLSGVGNTTYTTNAVTADCTVVAHFTIDQHTVTPSVAGGNGTITPSTPQLVDHGATTVFTLAPTASHHVASVDGTCNGTLSGVGNTTYTTNAINSDCTVVAHFAIDRHTVGGSVSGLVGSALVLRLNGGNDLLIGANGSFVFAQPIDDLSAYAVTIAQQPTGPTQVCTVANGSGTIAGSDVTNVAISCPAPQAHLSVTVSDGRSYVHYGMLLNYIVTITNDGNGDATGVSVSNVSPPQLDVASTTWTCQGAGGGATCAASGNGALNDNNVKLPIGRTLTWIVTSPVRLDASGGGIGYTVNVTGAGSASATDQDVMVIMRTGMDVPYGDGAESVDDTAMVACTPAGSVHQRFDLTATRAFALPATASAAIDVVLVAHAANGAALRIERLNVGTAPRVRLVATDKSGVEHATAWATTVARATLTLGVATSGDQSVLLLDGSGIALEIVLPEGIDATVQAQVPTRDCGP